MRAAYALPMMLAAFWDAWRLLGGRYGDGSSAVPLLAMIVALAVPVARQVRVGAQPELPPPLLCAMLAAYAIAALFAPALVQIGVAVASVLVLVARASGRRLPSAPLAALGLLVLPVLPSLDFALAYPMRVVCAGLTATLLRLNGIAVGVDGVALRWGGEMLLFDAACSGVRMLWAALFLVSAIALAAGFGPWRYAKGIAVALAVTIAGNALRAASLFYVENGFVEGLRGPVVHEAVGVAAFALLGVSVALAVAPKRWRLA